MSGWASVPIIQVKGQFKKLYSGYRHTPIRLLYRNHNNKWWVTNTFSHCILMFPLQNRVVTEQWWICYIYSCGKPFWRTWKRTPSRTKSTSAFPHLQPVSMETVTPSLWPSEVTASSFSDDVMHRNIRMMYSLVAVGMRGNTVLYDNRERVRV